ncbi:phytoene desaturase family protein [Verrucomicrobiota bacterium sgz303538]
MISSDKIGIIGGGLGGLAAACTLAARGHEVILFEANGWLGGKAAVLRDRGFRFDMGPTILTLPSVLRRIFAEAGRSLDQELNLVRLDPQWRSFFDDGSQLDLVENNGAMARNIEALTNGKENSAGYQRFMAFSEVLHRISEKYFFYKPIGGMGDMFDWRGMLDIASLRDVIRMRLGRTVAETLRSFVPEPRVAQMLDHFTQYVGSAPDASPAVLCGIANMQTTEGIWYPVGGTRAVPEALERLALQLGVEIRTSTPIKRILTRNGAVSGVLTESGETVSLRAVISNSDSVRTHRELLDDHTAARRFERRRKYEPACSGVVLYLGLNKRYEQLAHHNFVFSRDPEEEFETIYRKGEPAPDPTCYVCAPACTEPEVAPAGGEALYVLVHTPYLRTHHDWRQMLPPYRRVILDKLRKSAGLEDIEDRIVVEHTLSPQDIHDRYRVLQGAIYGLASHGRFLGAFKPSNRSRDSAGLYLAGGAAHPGPGMPMVMMSGWIAADALHQDLGGPCFTRKEHPTLTAAQ